MTGELNKGDAVLYEAYDGQHIYEGQVIVFNKDDSRIVHRVVKIKTLMALQDTILREMPTIVWT